MGLDQPVDVLRLEAAGPDVDEAVAKPILPRIGVEVMGTDEPLEVEDDATAYARRHWKERQGRGFSLLPIVLFLFSMEGDKGYYSWLLKPNVSNNGGPTLTPHFSPTMTKITKTAAEVIFREAETWYEAMVQLLLRDKTSE